MKKLMMFDSKLGYRMGLGGANQVEKSEESCIRRD